MNKGRSVREHLLARHREIKPQLDACRRDALPTRTFSWRELVAEVFGVQRQAWRILGLVWLALISFHLAFGPERVPRPATPPPTAAIASWLNQLNAYGSLAQIDRRQ